MVNARMEAAELFEVAVDPLDQSVTDDFEGDGSGNGQHD